MIIFKRFILMLQFLTSIPLPVKLEIKNEDFGKGLIFAPVVGLLLGGILAGSFLLLEMFFPLYITSVLILILYILLTGGLHLDGLGDTFDGLFSGRPRERILEIMKDSRMGTNGVLALVCLLLLNAALFYGIGKEGLFNALLLMPVAGRMGSLIGAGVSQYARSGDGLGKSFIEYCGLKEIGIGSIFYFVIFFTVGSWGYLALSLLPVITAFLSVKLLSHKIEGATGDILGAVCEMNQTLFLIAVFVLRNVL